MSVGNVSSSASFVDAQDQGFSGLTADDFFKLLITQLQNQDPTEPVSNEELLQQIATMRNLQSNTELGDTLKQLANSMGTPEARATEQLSIGASYIGKSVTLDDTTIGVVDSALSQNGEILVGVNGTTVPLSQVVSVNTPASFANELVAVNTGQFNALGEPESVYGVVRSVNESSSPPTVQLERANANGQLITESYPLTAVTNRLTSVVDSGVSVTVVDSDGTQIQGPATPTVTNRGERAIRVNGEGPFTLNRILLVGG
ncbi:MAG: flagellar hook assembly protein FlgD [Planctomycetota bacterium]|jgi:flagellar basal-body rod modification protein FlgD